MSEFSQMIKEAFLGLEQFDALPGKAELKKSIEQYDRRERTMRWMAWSGVTFMTVILAAVVVLWVKAGSETSMKEYVAYVGVFVWAFTGVGMMKIWLMQMQNHFTLLKEMKRTQILMLESRPQGVE